MTEMDVSRRRLLTAVLAGAAGLLAGQAFGDAPTPKAPGLPKKVFAHYMVCCPTAGSQATIGDLIKEMGEAQRRGLDGFALNCGGWNKGGDYYKARCVQMYEAAKLMGTGFELFISMDYCCINYLDETRDAIETFRDHPNQFKVGGKPVLSTFGGEGHTPQPAQEKIALVHKMGGFFVPFFFPTNYGAFDDANVAEILKYYGEADGYFFFGAVGTGTEISRNSRRLAEAWHKAGKVYMAPITPYYRSYVISETRGFTSMAQEWEGAIRDGADWAEIVTWNDWNEKTYVAPFGAPSDTHVWGGDDDGYGAINYSHVAYLDASRYYVNWFKTGRQPKIIQDTLFYFYRTEPKAAKGKELSPKQIQQHLTSFPGADTLVDNVFVTCFLSKPAHLTIHSGTMSRTFDLPAGVHHVDMPFALGAQRFTLTRGGRILKDKTGEHEIADRQGETRYNYFSGEA